MGEGFKSGSGGYNPLNYKIVGNPQPINPKENTIWVDTDTKITKHSFSPTKPSEMAEGEVWFASGNNGIVSFNALKKNNLSITPYYAKQLIGGVLKDVTAKIYQNSEWKIFWDGTLYDKGNEYTDITGGWSGYPSSYITKNENSIYVQGYGFTAGAAYTNKKIDLSKFQTLALNVTGYSDNHGELNYRLIVSTENGPNMNENIVASVSGRTSGEITLNITNLSSSYYIGVYLSDTGGGYMHTATFNKVRLLT